MRGDESHPDAPLGQSVGRRSFVKSLTGIGAATTLGVVGTGAVTASGGDLVWAFEEPRYGIRSGPAAVGGTVYVGARDKKLYAINGFNGEKQWEFAAPDGELSTPALWRGTVFVSDSLGGDALYAVDAASGEEQWRFTEGRTFLSDPTVTGVSAGGSSDSSDGGTVFVGSGSIEKTLYAVDAETGDERWRFTEPEGAVFEPAVADGTVFVPTGERDKTLYAVDAETGEQQWRFTEPTGELEPPTVADGTVYVGSENGLYAVDAASGEQEWAFTTPTGQIGEMATVANGTVYAGARDDTLYAVDATTGEEEWAFTEPSSWLLSAPTVAGDSSDGSTVFVGDDDGILWAVDATTGEREWLFSGTTDSIRASPIVVDGTVYFATNAATVYAVDAGVEGSSIGSRAQFPAGSSSDQSTTATTTETPDDASGTDGPGFGLVSGVAGLASAGYLLGRRD